MKIKHIITITTTLLVSLIFAQNDSTKLFQSTKFESSFLVDFGSDFLQVNDGSGMQVNFALHWIVKRKFMVGAAYSQLASVEKTKYSDDLLSSKMKNAILKHQSLGLQLSYLILPEKKVISLQPSVMTAWANATIKDETFVKHTNFVKLQPQIALLFNCSSFFRVGMDFHYRLHFGDDLENKEDENYYYSFSPTKLNGLGGGIFLRFGKF